MLINALASHPEFFLGGCLAWVIVVAWIMTLMSRMIMLEVDALMGTMGICLTLGLGYMSIKPPVPVMQPVSILALLLSGFMIPILKFAYDKRELKSADIEQIERAYDGFVFRPNNPTAQIRLARYLYQLGVRGHALVLAEGALQQLPRQYFMEEYRMVEAWRQHPPHASEFEPIQCVECQTLNAPGTIHCVQCGARYLLDRVKGRVVSKSLGRKILAAWILLVLALVGLPYAAAVGGAVGLGVIAGITVAAVVTAIVAFRPGKDSTA